MFKAIHGIAPNYLSDHFDIHGYDTSHNNGRLSSDCGQEIYKYSFFNIWVANFGMICQILWRTLPLHKL